MEIATLMLSMCWNSRSEPPMHGVVETVSLLGGLADDQAAAKPTQNVGCRSFGYFHRGRFPRRSIEEPNRALGRCSPRRYLDSGRDRLSLMYLRWAWSL